LVIIKQQKIISDPYLHLVSNFENLIPFTKKNIIFIIIHITLYLPFLEPDRRFICFSCECLSPNWPILQFKKCDCCARFECITLMLKMIEVLGDITLWRPVKSYRCFRRSCCLHLQGQAFPHERLICLDLENAGSRLLRNSVTCYQSVRFNIPKYFNLQYN